MKVWHSREGRLHTEDLEALISEKTRLINLSLVSFYNGFRIDLEEISQLVRKSSDAVLTLDATQGAGRISFDAEQVDIVVSSTHKWLMGSHGACIIAIPKTSKMDWCVRAGGWHNLEDPFNSNRFDQAATVMPGADGFMLGMPGFPAVYAVERSLAYLLRIGVHNIEHAANPLVKYAIEELEKLPVNLITPNQDKNLAGILSFTHADAENICLSLNEKNVSVIYHAGRIRLAIHGYNNEQDIEAFLSHLITAL